MTSELKSMFGGNLAEPSQIDNTEKQNKEAEDKMMKDYLKKQTGMKRELIKLIGGVPSLTSAHPRNVSMKGELGQQWVWSCFNNPAREDKCKLFHWQRKEDVNKDYEFAELNHKIELIDFSQEEYNQLIKPTDQNWSYEETRYLWELLTRFDLRFTVVYDRYDEKAYHERTVEELKDRYYSICRKILEHRKIYDHPILKSGYNIEQEMKRRTYLERTMNRSNEEIIDETNLLRQADEIEKKLVKYEKIEENYKKINFEPKQGTSFEEYIRANATENDSFVYLRSQKMKHNLPISEKIQNKVEAYIRELNHPEKLIPTVEVEIAFDTLRNNIVLYTSLKKYLEKKEKEYVLLNNKLKDLKNKKTMNQNSQITPFPSQDQNVDSMSMISYKKEKRGKNGTPTKPKKRKTNDEPEAPTSHIKKMKKTASAK